MLFSDDINNYIKKIAEQFMPAQIILFGSYANGNARKDSDVDILVIMVHNDKAWQQAAKIRSSVETDFAVDVIVRSPDEIAERLSANDPFIIDIIKNGKVCYESPYN